MQTAVRMPASWIARLDAIGDRLSQTGLGVSQAAVIRVALARGISALEAEYGLAAEAVEKPEKGAQTPARKPRPPR